MSLVIGKRKKQVTDDILLKEETKNEKGNSSGIF